MLIAYSIINAIFYALTQKQDHQNNFKTTVQQPFNVPQKNSIINSLPAIISPVPLSNGYELYV